MGSATGRTDPDSLKEYFRMVAPDAPAGARRFPRESTGIRNSVKLKPLAMAAVNGAKARRRNSL
jgi:hypothetical protein